MNIDYRAMPGVQEALQKMEAMRRSDNADIKCHGEGLYAFAGTEFSIVVRVTDPALAQLALLSIFDVAPAINLPGLQIAEVCLRDEKSRQVIRAWLQERLKERGEHDTRI